MSATGYRQVRSRRSVALVLLMVAAGCASAAPPTASASGDHDGLDVAMQVRGTSDSLWVDTVVRNSRTGPVHLDADQCGRVTEVVLARTVFEPEGATYSGSLGAVKKLLLEQQRSDQSPDRFAPRRVTGGSGPPDCVRPTQPVAIPPGGSIAERWELPFGTAVGLAAVGSDHATVRAEAVESVAADKLDFLDILPTGAAEAVRQGRNVAAEIPVSAVLDRAPTRPETGPSLGQRFDRMIENATVRDFVAARPATSWRRATILPAASGALEFRAVTTAYERALVVDLASDGTVVGDPGIPGPDDVARALQRRPARLPPGITVIPEPDAPALTEDVIAGTLSLPTGRVVADGALTGQATPLSDVARPGAYPVSVTVGRLPGNSTDQVAYASLVVSDAPTVRWVARSTVAVDGGTAGFTSAEGSEMLGRMDAATSLSTWATAFDSLTAHDDLVTTVPLGDGLDMALFTSGYGDGGYGVYVGLDADGKPTQYVLDFAIVHLAWP